MAEEPLDSSESTPERLQQRIDGFRKRRRAEPGLGRAMALVMSLGVSLVAVMYGSYVLGGILRSHTGLAWILPATLLTGVVAAAWVGYLLIRPLLREDS